MICNNNLISQTTCQNRGNQGEAQSSLFPCMLALRDAYLVCPYLFLIVCYSHVGSVDPDMKMQVKIHACLTHDQGSGFLYKSKQQAICLCFYGILFVFKEIVSFNHYQFRIFTGDFSFGVLVNSSTCLEFRKRR